MAEEEGGRERPGPGERLGPSFATAAAGGKQIIISLLVALAPSQRPVACM